MLTSYLVANGIVLPISAFLSRVFGRKQFFLICIVMFTVCSFLCGIATELWQIILFRVMQGFFGGGLQPTQQSVLLDYFKPEDRGKAFGLSSIAIIVAPVLGPTLGGWITDNYSRRWVFFINIPVGIVTVLAIYQLLEDPPWESKSKEKLTIDWTGIGLIALGLGCLQVMLDRGEDEDWFYSNFIRTFGVLTLVGIIGAIYWLVYARKPVVDLHCMKDRNFAISSLLMAGMAMILYGSSVVIPQLAQRDWATPLLVGAGAVARRGADRVNHSAGAEADAGGADALDYCLWLYLSGGVVLLVAHADAGYRLRNAGAVPQRPVNWAGVPVCAADHHCLYFDSETAQRRCGSAVYHVPQRCGLDWDIALDGGHHRTRAGAQRASGVPRLAA